jgi:hypothetical protein
MWLVMLRLMAVVAVLVMLRLMAVVAVLVARPVASLQWPCAKAWAHVLSQALPPVQWLLRMQQVQALLLAASRVLR